MLGKWGQRCPKVNLEQKCTEYEEHRRRTERIIETLQPRVETNMGIPNEMSSRWERNFEHFWRCVVQFEFSKR